MKYERGFTLVEMVLVVVLTSVVAALAVGGLKGARRWQAGNAVRRVQADLTFARDRARSTGRRTMWVFASAQQSYELWQEAAPCSGALNAAVMTDAGSGGPWSVALGALSPGLKITSVRGVNDGRIGFDRFGSPLNSAGNVLRADVRIPFSNNGTVLVKSVSGEAQVTWK